MTPEWKPTDRQQKRADRSRKFLQERKIPMWGNESKSLYVEDDEAVSVQIASDVARRALVLWAVTLRADGYDWMKSRKILTDFDLMSYLSPKELEYMDDPAPAANISGKFVWRLESLWILLWALGRLSDLPWNGDMCNVPALADEMNKAEIEPDFIRKAVLLPTATLLDAQDLTLKIHWAIRDAYIKGLFVPENLDWRNDGVPVEMCAAVGVVEQRHYALNWILKFMNPENWDEVDTPT